MCRSDLLNSIQSSDFLPIETPYVFVKSEGFLETWHIGRKLTNGILCLCDDYIQTSGFNNDLSYAPVFVKTSSPTKNIICKKCFKINNSYNLINVSKT